MRCICCNAMLPPTRRLKKITIPHPEDATKVIIKELPEEEDFCTNCQSKANPNYDYDEDYVLDDLGIDFSQY